MDLSVISRYEPMHRLSEEGLNDLLANAREEQLNASDRLQAWAEREWYVFLLEGEVSLEARCRPAEQVAAGSRRAARPLFLTEAPTEFAVAAQPTRLLKIERTRLDRLKKYQSQGDPGEIEVEEEMQVYGQSNLLHRLFQDYAKGQIPVPSLPESAVRVREIAEDPDASVEDLSVLVEQDPPIAAKVIAAANSALVRGRMKILTVADALVRLGMRQSCNLVLSAMTKELFQLRQKGLHDKLRELWGESVQVSAYARAIAREYRVLGADPDKAFLAGLFHDLGALALLAYMDELEPDPPAGQVDDALKQLRVQVSQMVLENWRMDEELVACAREARQWMAADNAYVRVVNIALQQAFRVRGEAEGAIGLDVLLPEEQFQAGELTDQGVFSFLVDNEEVEAIREVLAA